MEYIFRFSTAQGIFALPCDAVDLYINEASSDDLKILLFIYRHNGRALNEDRLCRSLGMTAEQVNQSIGFWISKNLFSAECANPVPDTGTANTPVIGIAGVETAARAAAQEAPQTTKKVVETPVQYSSDEISRKLTENTDLRFLLDAAAGLFGRPLPPSECSTLIYLYDGAGLPVDVILMLIEYCVTAGHANIRYIEKSALAWAEDGINSHELAEGRICELETRRSFEGQVKAVMGIAGRSLTQTERQHVGQWAQWNLSPELIKLAYEIGVNRTGKLSVPYINSILTAWHKKGYTTVEQAKSEKQLKNGKKTSYNIDEYVDLSMKRLLNE